MIGPVIGLGLAGVVRRLCACGNHWKEVTPASNPEHASAKASAVVLVRADPISACALAVMMCYPIIADRIRSRQLGPGHNFHDTRVCGTRVGDDPD